MSEVEDSKPEMFGVNPRVIAFFMIIVSLFVPLGYITHDIIVLIEWYPGSGIYGLFWFFGSYFFMSGFYLFDPLYLKLTVTLSIFNLLYVFQLVRYYQGKTTKKNVVVSGAISLIFPELFILVSTGLFLPLSMMGIVWPIPIQFLIGVFFLYKFPGPELLSSPIE
ncbi:MAG: hypothetical protein ACFFEL_02005 [Candidatus Thorarchaeota archaeon]